MIALAEPFVAPQAIPVLFIGGPLDGRELYLADVRLSFSASNPSPRSLRCEFGCTVSARCEIVDYRAFVLTAGQEHPDFVFYAALALGPVDIMRRLWKNYARSSQPAGVS